MTERIKYIKINAEHFPFAAYGSLLAVTYENFDALNGTGLRAPGYTRTSSVFLILLKEYLS